MRFYDFGILRFWGFGVLGFWGFGVLGFWGFNQIWNFQKSFLIKTPNPQNPKISKISKSQNLKTALPLTSKNLNYILYWVRTTTNGTLIQIANYTANTSTLYAVAPYGPYIAVFFQDRTAATEVNYAYELWNLDTLNTTYLQPRKQYLNIDSNYTQVPFIYCETLEHFIWFYCVSLHIQYCFICVIFCSNYLPVRQL